MKLIDLIIDFLNTRIGHAITTEMLDGIIAVGSDYEKLSKESEHEPDRVATD